MTVENVVLVVVSVTTAFNTVMKFYFENRSTKTLSHLENIATDTHTLVNNNMGNTLQLVVDSYQELYEATGLPKDKKKLDLAKEALRAHDERQQKVDEDVKRRESI